MRKISIDKVIVSEKYPTYFIAEIAGNFRTYNEGKKLVDAAVLAGANAVKLQTFYAEKIISKFAFFNMPNVGRKKSQLKVIRNLETDQKIQKKIFKYAKEKKITLFSTPAHKDDVYFLEQNDVSAYKVGSDDLTNLPLIKEISKLQKPTIISTGMSTMDEVKQAVKTFYSTGNKRLALLHCVSNYPFEPKYTNLNAIKSMKDKFGIPVGWSDHSIGVEVCIAAATLGANLIEKHFTINKQQKGPDHILSADPKDFSYLVKTVRLVEEAKGNGKKRPAECELDNIKNLRKSIVASKKITKGMKITADLVSIKRPGIGLPPSKLKEILGKIARRDIEKDLPLQVNFFK